MTRWKLTVKYLRPRRREPRSEYDRVRLDDASVGEDDRAAVVPEAGGARGRDERDLARVDERVEAVGAADTFVVRAEAPEERIRVAERRVLRD